MSNIIKFLTGIKDTHFIFDKTKYQYSELDDFKILNFVQSFDSPKCCHGFNMIKNGKTPPVLILCSRSDEKPLFMGVRKQKFICKNWRLTRVFPISGVEEHCSISNNIKQ